MTREVMGGGPQYVPTAPGAFVDPEVERDRVLLGQAIERLRGRIRARAIAKAHHIPSDSRLLDTLQSMARDMVRNQGRRSTRLSPKVRGICCEVLGLKTLPPLPAARVPDVLKTLPLKPPGR